MTIWNQESAILLWKKVSKVQGKKESLGECIGDSEVQL